MLAELPETYKTQKHMKYLIEVYVDNFMAIVIPTSIKEVTHVGQAVGNDPIAKNKLLKGKGQKSTTKTLLGFDFNGKDKTMWLEMAKRNQLTPNYIAQLDPHEQAQRTRDTVQRIRICPGQNTTRIYSPAGQSRVTFTMQCSDTKKARYRIPPAKRGTKTSITPLQDAPPRIKHATNHVQRTSASVARLHRHLRRIVLWVWRCYHG